MQTTTLLVCPCVTELGSQMRIVKRHDFVGNALRNYREQPDLWAEVGLIRVYDERGEKQALVCLTAPREIQRDVADCLPLIGGSSLSYDFHF